MKLAGKSRIACGGSTKRNLRNHLSHIIGSGDKADTFALSTTVLQQKEQLITLLVEYNESC